MPPFDYLGLDVVFLAFHLRRFLRRAFLAAFAFALRLNVLFSFASFVIVGFRPLLWVGVFSPTSSLRLCRLSISQLCSFVIDIAIAAAANNPALLILVFV